MIEACTTPRSGRTSFDEYLAMARAARPDWRQVLDPETGHWCWHSALRQESRWEKPPIREGWMEWRDANGNAFYVDDNGASTWDPPWADDDADEAPETTREAPDAPMHPPAPPPPPVAKTDAIDALAASMDRAAPKAPVLWRERGRGARNGQHLRPAARRHGPPRLRAPTGGTARRCVSSGAPRRASGASATTARPSTATARPWTASASSSRSSGSAARTAPSRRARPSPRSWSRRAWRATARVRSCTPPRMPAQHNTIKLTA